MIVLLNGHVKTVGNLDEIKVPLKKEAEIANVHISSKGIDAIAAWVKKTVKKFENKTMEFYRKKWMKLKKKQSSREKMPKANLTFYKLSMKMGLLSEIVHNHSSAFEEFKQAYNHFKGLHSDLSKYYSVWEIKAVGDVLEGKQAQYYVGQLEFGPLLKLFKTHYADFKIPVHALENKSHYLEYKWRVKLFQRHTDFLKQCLSGSDVRTKKEINRWLSFFYTVSAGGAVVVREDDDESARMHGDPQPCARSLHATAQTPLRPPCTPPVPLRAPLLSGKGESVCAKVRWRSAERGRVGGELQADEGLRGGFDGGDHKTSEEGDTVRERSF